MGNPLLDRVLPTELAERSQAIEYKGVLGDFERLVEVVGADLEALAQADRPQDWRAAPVSVSLEFYWLDGQRPLPAVKGRIRADLATVCQRCLEAFTMPVETSVSVVFTGRGAAADFAALKDCEIWEQEADTIRLLDVVEEVLIMALPVAPAHKSPASCGPLAKRIAATTPATTRPFADLRSQMGKTNKRMPG